MAIAHTRDLYDTATNQAFYEKRYQVGYMESWPAPRQRRVADVLSALHLPTQGTALDFGCGNGVFTQLLKQLLPRWTVVGCDISLTAISNAQKRWPDCTFMEVDRCVAGGQHRFDLLFTHHVLEHVSDLTSAIDVIAALVKPHGSMLHILPCGNAGTIEHELCTARPGGIDTALEGRFFLEEEGHVRRLTTERLAATVAAHGFALGQHFYANQYYGSVKWMSEQPRAWLKAATDPSAATDADARARVKQHRRLLLAVNLVRRPPSLLRPGAEWRLGKAHRTWKDWAILIAGNPFSVFAPVFDYAMQRAADREWATRRTDPAGSEMFLEFRR